MSTPATPVVVNNQPPQRSVTQGEVQRFLADAWLAANVRLSPGRLSDKSFDRVDSYARQNHLDLLKAAYKVIWSDYKEAVRLQADAYFQSVRALMFEPQIASQKTFDPLALSWTVEPSVVGQRRRLTLENQGLAAQGPSEMPDRQKKEEEAFAKVQADKAHQDAVKAIERAIQGVIFQNMRGIDQAKIDKVRAELREYVQKNLGKHNGVKVLENVTQQIAAAHRQHEREQEQWNSR